MSKTRRISSLDGFLRGAAAFAPLATHAALLLRAQTAYAQLVPANLAAASQVANLRRGTLIVMAANSGVAVKLRQVSPRILNGLRYQGLELTGLEVRVQPQVYPRGSARPHQERVAPGTAARAGMGALAERLDAASPMTEALRRLLDRLA